MTEDVPNIFQNLNVAHLAVTAGRDSCLLRVAVFIFGILMDFYVVNPRLYFLSFLKVLFNQFCVKVQLIYTIYFL